MQRAEWTACRNLGLSRAGVSPGRFLGQRAKRIHPAIQRLDAVIDGIKDFNRGYLSGPNHAGKIDSGGKGEVGGLPGISH